MILSLLITALPLAAAVRIPAIFSDGMVLQRGKPVAIFGWADPGEKVIVSFAGRNEETTTGKDGHWIVHLKTMDASNLGQELTVRGQNTITIKDVLVGEVWHCAGQSNMGMKLSGVYDFDLVMKESEDPLLRHYRIDDKPSEQPADDTFMPHAWTAASPKTVGRFTATGYFFAMELRRELKVPVGLINTSMGGTVVEVWLPAEGFKALEGKITPREQGKTSLFFNARVNPIIPFTLRGVIWYQGCSNSLTDEDEYVNMTEELIRGWRKMWNDDFPFFYVQFQGYDKFGHVYARLRESQARFLEVPGTAMAVTIDVGGSNLHSENKLDIGKRLALAALALTYGRKCEFSGPIYRSLEIKDGGKMHVTFDHVGSGLICGTKTRLESVKEGKDGIVGNFQLAGKDGKYYDANGVIDGDAVIVSSPDVPAPVSIRYLFTAMPIAEQTLLYNKEGLPAGPFRTDNFPRVD